MRLITVTPDDSATQADDFNVGIFQREKKAVFTHTLYPLASLGFNGSYFHALRQVMVLTFGMRAIAVVADFMFAVIQ